MSTWSAKRRFKYALGVFFALVVFVGIPAFLLFYKTPTCFDGKQNGGEQGVDCGGSCTRLCQSAFLPPKVAWGGGKFEKITDSVYNLSSYIINPNVNGGASNVPYKFTLYDSQGTFIGERSGVVNINPHRNSLAFESSVNLGDKIPAKVLFGFTESPRWFKSDDALEGLSILNKDYREDGKNSVLEVTLENRTLYPYKDIDVYAILYDINSNTIGFSKTKVDTIPTNSTEKAIFTWPFSRNSRVVSIEVIPNTKPIENNNI